MDEYENDKWRLIAGKVGSGFSPAACQEKAEELEIQEEFDDETSSESQAPLSASMHHHATSSPSRPAVSAHSLPYTTMNSSGDTQPATSAYMQHYQ
jgi:hypothetical protein